MKRVAAHPQYRFHPGCKSLKLNCLAFADDILVFRKGHDPSVQLIVAALDEFKAVSGLTASPVKSRLYVGGCSSDRIRGFYDQIGFSVGEYPMRYLIFPLSPKKWSKTEC